MKKMLILLICLLSISGLKSMDQDLENAYEVLRRDIATFPAFANDKVRNLAGYSARMDIVDGMLYKAESVQELDALRVDSVDRFGQKRGLLEIQRVVLNDLLLETARTTKKMPEMADYAEFTQGLRAAATQDEINVIAQDIFEMIDSANE